SGRDLSRRGRSPGPHPKPYAGSGTRSSVRTRDERDARSGRLHPDLLHAAQLTAHSKGKVERPIRYVRGSFVYARDFVGDEDLNAQTLTWLSSRANVRKHRTTGERPLDRF